MPKTSSTTMTSTQTQTRVNTSVLLVAGLAAAAVFGYVVVSQQLSSGLNQGPSYLRGGTVPGYAPETQAYCSDKCRIAYNQCLGRGQLNCSASYNSCVAYCFAPITPGYNPPGYMAPGYTTPGYLKSGSGSSAPSKK